MHTINARGHKGSHCLIFSKGVAEPCDEEELFTIAMLAVLNILLLLYAVYYYESKQQTTRKKERKRNLNKKDFEA